MARHRLSRWRAEARLGTQFWALTLAVLLFNIGMAVFFFLYNLFMLDLGYRERPLGILAGALALGGMAGTIPMGFAAQRFGVRRVLVISLLAMSAAFAARLFLLWCPVQIAFAIFDGVALCGWVVCLSPAIAALVEERRRPAAFSIIFAVAVAAGSLGGLIGGNMPKWWGSLELGSTGRVLSPIDSKRVTLLTACAVTALAAWPIARLAFAEQSARARKVEWFRPSPFLLRFLLASTLWAAAVGAFNPFTNVFFVRYVGIAAAHLGNFFAIVQLLQAGAVLLVPLVVRRCGLISGILAAQIVTATAVALLAAGHGLLAAEAFYCVFMAAQHMCDPAMQNLLMDRIPEAQRSGATALNFLAISIAQAAAATIAGIAFQRFGYPRVLIGVALATIAAAAAFRLLLADARPASAGHQSVGLQPEGQPAKAPSA